MTEQSKCNGWTNRATWNVALWIGNDEGLYRMAKECKSYEQFVECIKDCAAGTPVAYETPDGVSWTDSALDIEELDNMISELNS